MEEVAYTWFNRFIAIRFMEVNGYLPSHVRVFSDDNGNFNPQILSEAIHIESDKLDMNKVMQLKEESNDDELFKYLLITNTFFYNIIGWCRFNSKKITYSPCSLFCQLFIIS